MDSCATRYTATTSLPSTVMLGSPEPGASFTLFAAFVRFVRLSGAPVKLVTQTKIIGSPFARAISSASSQYRRAPSRQKTTTTLPFLFVLCASAAPIAVCNCAPRFIAGVPCARNERKTPAGEPPCKKPNRTPSSTELNPSSSVRSIATPTLAASHPAAAAWSAAAFRCRTKPSTHSSNSRHFSRLA